MKTIEKAATKSRVKAKHADSPITKSVRPEIVEGFVPLSTVVTINPRKFTAPITDEDIVSFVPMKCVEEETGNLDATTLRSWHEVKKGYTAFQDNDVIFAKITPCMENGKFAIARGLKGGRAAGSTEFHVLRPTERLSSHYLMHFLFQHHIRQDARMNMRGAAGQLRVPTDFFESLKIPLPPLPTQHRIVAEIEEKLSRLDAAQSALLRAQANLKRYKASVIAQTCHAFDADLPAGWQWKTLPQLGTLGRGKSKHRPRDDQRLYDGPYPFIQTGEVRHSNGRIKVYEKTYSEFGLAQSKLWPVGTLCITIAANIAETGILEFQSCFPDSVVGFCAEGQPLLVEYVELYIRSMKEVLERLAPATAQKNINLDLLSKVRVAVPSQADLPRVMAEAERRLSVIDRTEQTLRTQLERAKRLRQSILQQAFKPS